jgi:putative ABC transport system ATP-binding protein
LADEPTGALDSRTGGEILAVFHRLNRTGQTVVMITHDPEVAAKCGRTVHIRDGRIVEDGKARRRGRPGLVA